ncbi:MAG: hypothetical protein Q8J88_09215 [Bacteroidales bacterium]|nr:hypothetical protein [Bacteroidales bacterium]
MTPSSVLKTITYYAVSLLLIVILADRFFIEGLLNSANFLNWDAMHYARIKDVGYNGFDVAFFPFLPLIWKHLSLGVGGMVVFNALLYLTSLYFLLRSLKSSVFDTLLFLSIPSAIFFYLPYTESLFFAASTLIILGYKKENMLLFLLGLFLSTLSRPAFTVFIPALLVTGYLAGDFSKKALLKLVYGLLAILLGMLVVGIVQYTDTGQWFQFFEAQKVWENKLQFPAFPLTSWAGGLIVRLDGAAFLTGTAAGVFLLLYLFKVKFLKNIILPKEVIFSISYLAGITFSVLIFRGGSMFSLNRFVFAVPFIIVAIDYYLKSSFTIGTKRLLLSLLVAVLFFLMFGSYVHLQNFLKFLFLAFYVILPLALKHESKPFSVMALLLLIGLNVFFQLFFYIRFLTGGWIG